MKAIQIKTGYRIWLFAFLVILVSRGLVFAEYWDWKMASDSTQGLFSALFRWDSGWYASIVENGYVGESVIISTGEAPWAFFPLVPLLERLAMRITGLPVRIAGVLMNTVFLYLLTVFGAKFILAHERGGGNASRYLYFVPELWPV